MRTALILTCALSLLLAVACGGGGTPARESEVPPGTQVDPPATPTLAAAARGIKTIAFSWDAVADVTHYKLRVDPDGGLGFAQVGTDIPSGETSVDHTLPVHLTDWVNVRYELQACNAGGCTSSAPVAVVDLMLGAIGYIKASNTSEDAGFGSVALSGDGNTLAVGAAGESSASAGVGGAQDGAQRADSGAVYVFRRSGSTWTQQAYVKASNPGEEDYFGAGLALSEDGNTLAVGAPDEGSAAVGIDGDSLDDSAWRAGAVYVFVFAGGAWTQETYIKASNTGGGDEFGSAVALSDDGAVLAVGAPYERSGSGADPTDDSIEAAGAVYVFRRGARLSGGWQQESYVKPSDPDWSDRFGGSLALSGDGLTLAVGARQFGVNEARQYWNLPPDDDIAESGTVYVFEHALVGRDTTWLQQARLKASNAGEGDHFGNAVALSRDGGVLAVGAEGESSGSPGVGADPEDNSARSAGAAYIFERSGASWSETAYVKSGNPGTDYYFGIRIDISQDGNTLAVGAWGETGAAAGVGGVPNDDSENDAGAVYVFRRVGGIWSQRAYVKAANNASDGDMSFAFVALSGDGNTLAVGAHGEDGGGTGVGAPQGGDTAPDSGAVYIH